MQNSEERKDDSASKSQCKNCNKSLFPIFGGTRCDLCSKG